MIDETKRGRTYVENPDEAWKDDAGLGTIRLRPDGVVRSCLVVLTVLSLLSAFYFAQSILVPLTLAIILATPLRPLVEWLAKKGVPQSISALFGLAAIGAVLLLVVVPIATQVRELRLTDPVVLRGHADTFKQRIGPLLSFATELQESAESIGDEIADEDEGGAGLITQKKVEKDESTAVVMVEKPPPLFFDVGGDAVGTTTTFLSAILIGLVTIYFVLCSGDQLVARFVDIGETAEERGKLQSVVSGVKKGLAKYLATVTVVNLGLGVAVGVAMWLLGVPGAVLIGFMAFLFNFVPMVGALIGVAIAGLVAVMNFPPEDWLWWLVVPAVYLTLTTIEGNFVTPALIGHSMKMNPLMVFLSLVLWGWLWGLAGVIVAVPILAAVKAGLENFESTREASAMIG